MKKNIVYSSLIASFLLAIAAPAASAADFVGNWKGTLAAGPAKLRIHFKITKQADGMLTAKMDSVDQGAKDIGVDKVTLQGDKLRLEVASVNGVYEGTLDAAGKRITGHWTQGVEMPLNLERTKEGADAAEAEEFSPTDLVASKLAVQKLSGVWTGELVAGPATLHLRVKIAKTATGAATGMLDSIDQGAKDIPVSGITLKEKVLHFEVRGIFGSYDGTMSADGAIVTGTWKQAAQSVPLELKRTPVAR